MATAPQIGLMLRKDIPPQIEEGLLPPQAELIAVHVSSIDVQGSTVYSAADFAQLLQPHLGRVNTLVELYALADAIVAKYQADGYAFTKVRVPGQYVGDGKLELQILESRISKVDFELDGHAVPVPPRLQSAVATILTSRLTRLASVEAAVAAAKAMPDYHIATTRFRAAGQGEMRLTAILVRPGEAGVVLQPESNASAPQAAAADFRLNEVRITGGTVFTHGELAELYTPLLGKDVTPSQIYDLARRIGARYAAAGYFGCQATVPPQFVRNGVVEIEVRALAIDKVAVYLNNDPVLAGDLLFNIANAVTESKPATNADIQRQMFIMQQVPGAMIDSVIPPVAADTDAEVRLRRQPYSVTMAMDNRGTEVAGPFEAGVMLKEDGMFGLNEEIQLLGLSTMHIHEMTYGGTTVILPLTSSGLVATAGISRTRVNPTGYLLSSDIAVQGDMITTGLSYPLFANAQFSTLATLNLDVFNNQSTALGGRITANDERSRALRFGMLTTFIDDIGGKTTFKTVFSQGINALGARPNGEQLNNRPGMKLDASEFDLDIRRDQQLPENFKLSLGLVGQVSFNPLPAAEVFTFGGVDFGRAYDGGIISGDHGFAGKAQLSRPILLDLSGLPLIEPYTYYDIGRVWSALVAPGGRSTESAASAGLGTKFFTEFGVGGSLEVDWPLTHVATSSPNAGPAKPPRVFFLVFTQF
ncbi:MAG: hypothetical protein HQL37_06070 [Alphaproteobacteria bacterium]|nr:hypothetical protein [Alphaproteobacteria bacterium]